MKRLIKGIVDGIKAEWPVLVVAFVAILLYVWSLPSVIEGGLSLTLKDGSISISCNEGPLNECLKQDILIQFSDE